MVSGLNDSISLLALALTVSDFLFLGTGFTSLARSKGFANRLVRLKVNEELITGVLELYTPGPNH